MQQTFAISPQILRLNQVKAKTGLCRSSIYSFIKAGTFPERVPLGVRSVGWIDREVDLWIQSRLAARQQRSIA
jgi:prophage regulatory protein